jgi:penicillin-insensitive murein endopeptidase
VQDVEVIFPDLMDPKPAAPKKDDSKADDKGGKSDQKTDKKDDKKDDEKDSKKDDQKSDPESDSDSKDNGIVKTIVRKVNQAVTAMVNRKGRPNFTIGRLENATNIYSYQLKVSDAGFRFVYPKRETYFGTDDMLAALVSIGQFNKAHVNGYVNNVGDVSKEKGGQLGSHSSHQMGIDADISYYFSDKEKQKGLEDAVASSKPVKSFMEEEQWEMFKSLTEKNIVTFIFVDKAIKKDLCALAARKGEVKSGDTTSVAFKTLRLLNTTAPGHDDHFHLRLKCSQAQPRCRQQPLPTGSSTGC